MEKEFINIEREKERKTPEVLDWNWRNQNELMFFSIYVNRVIGIDCVYVNADTYFLALSSKKA